MEYARYGIPPYWRVETTDPYSVDIHTYRLGDGSKYTHTATFTGDQAVSAVGLEWAEFTVAELIDGD